MLRCSKRTKRSKNLLVEIERVADGNEHQVCIVINEYEKQLV